MADPTCYEVIRELDPAMRDVLDPGQEYIVMGGIASSAIEHDATYYDHVSQTVEPVCAADRSVFREENQTRRDIDLLVVDRLDPERIAAIKVAATDAIDQQLKVSVFDLEAHQPVLTGLQRLMANQLEFISKRTMDDDGVIRIELFPLVQELPRATFDPYHLVLPGAGGRSVPVFNPAGHIMAYRMRSITGLRDKDQQKVWAMQERGAKDPEICDMADGLFQSWAEFAAGIEMVRAQQISPNHPMMREGTTYRELAHFRRKSRGLAALEGNKVIRKIAQEGLGEKATDLFTRAK